MSPFSHRTAHVTPTGPARRERRALPWRGPTARCRLRATLPWSTCTARLTPDPVGVTCAVRAGNGGPPHCRARHRGRRPPLPGRSGAAVRAFEQGSLRRAFSASRCEPCSNAPNRRMMRHPKQRDRRPTCRTCNSPWTSAPAIPSPSRTRCSDSARSRSRSRTRPTTRCSSPRRARRRCGRRCVVKALFDADADRDAIAHALASAVADSPPPRFEAVPDRAWEREWLKDFRPMRFGRRLWVCPGGMPADEPGRDPHRARSRPGVRHRHAPDDGAVPRMAGRQRRRGPAGGRLRLRLRHPRDRRGQARRRRACTRWTSIRRH